MAAWSTVPTYARIHARDVVHVLPGAVPTALGLNPLGTFLVLDHQLGALVGLRAVLVSGDLGVHHLFLILVVTHFSFLPADQNVRKHVFVSDGVS